MSCADHVIDEMEQMDMEEILNSVGLEQMVDVFKENKIGPREVLLFKEEDYLALGVHNIGDKVRIREQCRQKLQGDESPVVSRVRELQQKRKKPKAPLSKTEASTRRISFGWKHKSHGSHALVHANKGGGKLTLDIKKDMTLNELLAKVSNCYFPNGKNATCNLYLRHLDYHLATFTGERLGERLATVGEYLKELKTSPIRLYLYTELKSDSDDELPELSFDISQELPVTPVAGDSTQLTNTQQSLPVLAGETTQTIPTTDVQDPEDDFIDADTPTVQFRRNRLSLRRTGSHVQTTSTSETPSSSSRSDTVWIPIEVIDSSDEEFQAAIEASIAETSPSPKTLPTVNDVLNEFQSEIQESGDTFKIVASRTNILDSAIRALYRKTLNLRAKVFVKFSGEQGEDHGGPRREFFRLALKSLGESSYFEGPENSKYFSHNLERLDMGYYRVIGRLVALSLAQEGPGLCCLNTHLYDFMTGKNPDMSKIDIDLPEYLGEIVQQLNEAKDQSQIERFVVDHGDYLMDMGLNAYRTNLATKNEMVAMIKKNFLFYRISAEISQFFDGMNDVNRAGEMLKNNAEVLKPLFCFQPIPLTCERFESLFTVQYSEQGSNRKCIEDATIYSWELFLQSIEEKQVPITFEDLLAFVTGADHVPPCGFSSPIGISFFTQEENESRLPHVSTCSLQLWLPRGISPATLSDHLCRAVKESAGFLKV